MHAPRGLSGTGSVGQGGAHLGITHEAEGDEDAVEHEDDVAEELVPRDMRAEALHGAGHSDRAVHREVHVVRQQRKAHQRRRRLRDNPVPPLLLRAGSPRVRRRRRGLVKGARADAVDRAVVHE